MKKRQIGDLDPIVGSTTLYTKAPLMKAQTVEVMMYLVNGVREDG